MKKLKLFLAFALIATISNAQFLPRWGSGPPTNDNTGRVLTYNYVWETGSTSSTDTISIYPNAYVTYYQFDSLINKVIVVSRANADYTGDWIEFYGVATVRTYTPTIEFRNSNGISYYQSIWKFADSVPIYKASSVQYFLGADSTFKVTKGKYFDILFHYDGLHFNEVWAKRGH